MPSTEEYWEEGPGGDSNSTYQQVFCGKARRPVPTL